MALRATHPLLFTAQSAVGLPINGKGKTERKNEVFMNTIRWIRVIFSSIFILLGLIFGSYFYIKEHPQGTSAGFSHSTGLYRQDFTKETI